MLLILEKYYYIVCYLQILLSQYHNCQSTHVIIGFSEELRVRPMKALSGGWKVRTMLAAGN